MAEGAWIGKPPCDLGPLTVSRRIGTEAFASAGAPAGFNLLEFWQWSASDLVNNTSRGVLAEFIVAKALDVDISGARMGWARWDLETSDGLRIEVKSAAYCQSWGQTQLSTVQFAVPKRRAFDSVTGTVEPTLCRHAHVYVFALLAHEDKPTIDPMNLDQWRFYVLATRQLDERQRSQHSITLRSLEALAGPPVSFTGLPEAVRLKGEERRPSGLTDDRGH
jgi:hypothetical protein